MGRQKKGFDWLFLVSVIVILVVLAIFSYMTYVFIEKVCIGK